MKVRVTKKLSDAPIEIPMRGKKLHPGDEVTFLQNIWRVTEEQA